MAKYVPILGSPGLDRLVELTADPEVVALVESLLDLDTEQASASTNPTPPKTVEGTLSGEDSI
jgi:hypothetical protein